jgi:uncharacterized protein (UPF0335 family)
MDATKLKSYVDRIERLEEEQAAIGGDKKDIFAEAKSHGFNVKVLRRLIRERKKDTAEREQEEAELETYRAALTTGVALVKSGLSLRDAAKKSGASKSSIHRALSVPAVSHDADTGEISENGATSDTVPGDDEGTAVPSSPAPVVANLSSGGMGETPVAHAEGVVDAPSATPAAPLDLTIPDFLRRAAR